MPSSPTSASTKVAVITGGSSGIGLATAEAFARRGYAIVLNGRDPEALEVAKARVAELGVEVLAAPGDVSKMEDCQTLAMDVMAHFGRVDVLVNNAGISMRALFKDLDLSVIRRLMEVNFFGTVYCTKAFLPALLESKGSIVAVSSIAGYRGLPARTGYSASKAAMQGFMESLRTELLETGVHVLVACPGFTGTAIRERALTASGTSQGQSPLEEGKIMSAEEVGEAIAKATIARKRDLILTNQGKMTVFLNKLFPGWMDGMVLKHFKQEKDSPLQ